jgi:hypothetical protein
MIIDGRGFECQIFLEGKSIQNGETYQFTVKFMNFGVVSSFIALDKIITTEVIDKRPAIQMGSRPLNGRRRAETLSFPGSSGPSRFRWRLERLK